jgi:flagellin-specific chaperone FliS
LAPEERSTQELVVMYLSRAVEHVESIQKRLDAGEQVTEGERLDALTGLVNGLTACLAVVALKVDELGADA